MRNYMTVAVIGTALLIAGCNSPTGETGVVVEQDARADFVVQYIPTAQDRRAMPYPNDIWFSGSTDGTLNVPGNLSKYGASALNLASVNKLDGYSVNAPISVPFNFPVDITSIMPYMPIDELGTPMFGAATNFWVLNTSTGMPLFPLIPGVTDPIAQYEIRVSAATDAQGAVLEIVPIGPLDPDTTYAFVITAGVQDVLGNSLAPDNMFRDIRDACFSGETLSNASLEAIKTQAVCPVLQTAAGLFGLPSQAFMMAWTVSTQSISDSLDVAAAAATAGVSALQFTGLNTADVLPVPGIADIYAGFIEVPYYTDPSDPYGRGWQGAGGSDLSRYNPVPVATATIRIPMLMTLPNANSGQTKPAEGWPVLIFQHGVTQNRTNILPLADSYASQGFAVIAIDMPMHGILDPTNPLFAAPGNAAGMIERHLYIDAFDNATSAQVPDGIIDDGKQVFAVGLQAPLVARDIFNQGSVDLVQLTRTIPVMDFEGTETPQGPAPDGTPDFDGSRIHFMGHSLGATATASFLAIQNEVATGILANGGGPWTNLLTHPEALKYGTPLLMGLQAASGLAPGTLAFDDFIRDFQHALDRGDPAAYVAKAAENSPMLLLEVIGDLAVVSDGTDYLADVMGATTVSNGLTTDLGGIRGIVRFTSGGHGSLLDPSSNEVNPFTGEEVTAVNPLATTEMQTIAVTMAVTSGAQLAVGTSGCNCVQ